MRSFIAMLILAINGVAHAENVVETRVFEAASPQIFETAIKSIRVGDPSPQHQNLSLGTYGRSSNCETGRGQKVNSWVKRIAAGLGDLDMAAGMMTFAYQYEVRPAIDGGEIECWCTSYGKDTRGRTTGVCDRYETRVVKEPVFGDATKVVHARILRFKNQGTKYTVSFEIVPSDTVFTQELETSSPLSEKQRLKYAREEADRIFESLKEVLDGMASNAAASGRKLKAAETLLTDADRAAAATGPAGLYRLVTIDGQTLPYTTISMDIEVAEGSFVIHADGRFTQTLITGRGSIQVHGKYKLNGPSILLIEKGGGMIAGKLADNKELSISSSYGRLMFRK